MSARPASSVSSIKKSCRALRLSTTRSNPSLFGLPLSRAIAPRVYPHPPMHIRGMQKGVERLGLRTSRPNLKLYIVTVLIGLYAGTHNLWGRTGVDEDNRATVARRVLSTRKTGRLRNLPADNNGYALAA